MLTKDASQEHCEKITKDAVFMLQASTIGKDDRPKSMVICDSRIQGVKFTFDGSNEALVIPMSFPDGSGNIKVLNCYYGNFTIQEEDLRK
jgi:hypothetical protein